MSALSDTISRYIPIVGKKPKIDRKQALAIIPVRNSLVTWERKDREVILTIPLRDHVLVRFMRKLRADLPESRQIALDDVGGSVWELCDGERTINSVVDMVSKNYKLVRREAEASVTLFLQTLAKRNLIGLMSSGGKNNRVKRSRK